MQLPDFEEFMANPPVIYSPLPDFDKEMNYLERAAPRPEQKERIYDVDFEKQQVSNQNDMVSNKPSLTTGQTSFD